jgi:hypothetical protein
VPVSTPKSFLKCSLSNAEDGMERDIFWDDSQQSGKGASSSETESVTERSLEELSD